MRNLVVFMALLFCCVSVSFADGLIGVTGGGHDILLSEAPATYRKVSRMVGMVTGDHLSYARQGILFGVCEGFALGVSLGAGAGYTTALYDFVEVGLGGGVDLDILFVGLGIGVVPHARFQLKSLLPNSTLLYTTIADGFSCGLPTNAQAFPLYAFVGIQQRVSFLDFDFAVGNRNTVRAGVTLHSGSGAFECQILRSPDQNSVAFLKRRSF